MKIAVYYIGEEIANTVYDHLISFQLYGQNTYEYIDILKDMICSKEVEKYDAIIVHYTVSLFNDARCPSWLRVILRNANSKKIIFIQDEYRQVNDVVENLNYIKADLLYTCIPESEREKVYPTEKIPGLIKLATLTGFVPEVLLSQSRPSYENRQLDVVYRARKLSAWYGRLGQEKWMIAEKFKRDAQKYKLAVDISYQEQERIYGDQWIDFLKNSKAAIGCETGASVFDFTGTIQEQVEAYEKTYPDATFEETEEKFFKGLDGQININQISPRCFECAALGTLMILYEGDYSNILKPWRHYVPLKKDHSNMDQVVNIIRSPQDWKHITQYAFDEVAMNQKYHYKGFVENFENEIQLLFNNVVSVKKAEFIFSDLKSKFIPDKQIIRFQIMSFLKNGLNKIFGEEFTKFLVLFKRRFVLSLDTLRDLYLDREFSPFFYIYSFKKDFCEEYSLLKNIKEYVYCIKKKCNFVPVFIKNSCDRKKIMVYISDNSKESQEFCFSFSKASPQEICSLEGDNSWGIPQSIRGKKIILKYLKVFDNRNQF